MKKKSRLSLNKLRAMTLEQREKEFLKWVRGQEQNRLVNFMDDEKCPLARFGRFFIKKRVKGAAHSIYKIDGNTKIIKVLESISLAGKLHYSDIKKP